MAVAVFNLCRTLAMPGETLSQEMGDAIRTCLDDNFQAYVLTSCSGTRTLEMLGEGAELFDRVYYSSGSQELTRGTMMTHDFPDDLREYLRTMGKSLETRGHMLSLKFADRSERWRQRDWRHKVRRHLVNHVRMQWPDVEAFLSGETRVNFYPSGRGMQTVMQHITYHRGEIVFFADQVGPDEECHELARRILGRYGSVHAIRDPIHTLSILRSRRNY